MARTPEEKAFIKNYLSESLSAMRRKPKLIEKGFELIDESQHADWKKMVDDRCQSFNRGKEVASALKIMNQIKNNEEVYKVAYSMYKDIYLEYYTDILVEFMPESESYFLAYFRGPSYSTEVFEKYLETHQKLKLRNNKNEDFEQ